MELSHQSGEIIAQRYRIIKTLGQGGVGITYKAEDLQTSQKVALKSLSFRRINDWKVLELFEREAHILSHLNHPAIPRYLDYFQIDTPQDRGFYIVQELAEGKSLSVLVENGWKPDEHEVRYLATQILEILIYLHQLIPPVIHRDIKPQNIIRAEDGQVFLVDFGAVQDTYHHTVTGGSTIVGTYGYMAPEQFRGQAVLSTDLYGLGTTLLFILTGKSPADLPQRQLKIKFRPYLHTSKHFADWLEKMLEPVIEERFPSAKAALSVLQGEEKLASYSTQKPLQPKHTPIKLTKTEELLVVDIPPVWFRSKPSQYFGLATVTLNSLTWPIWSDIFLGYLNYTFPFGLFWILLGSWGLGSLIGYPLSVTSRTKLEIDLENFKIQKWCGGLLYKYQGRTEEIKQVKLSSMALPLYGKKIVLDLPNKWQSYSIGNFLTEPEKEWLLWEIRNFIEKIRHDSTSAIASLPESSATAN